MNLLEDIKRLKAEIAKKINKHTRERLRDDHEYRDAMKSFIMDLDAEEKVKYCMENDLNIFTMRPNERCDECGGMNHCSCHINHPG